MSIFLAALLGIVQGLTEFLPVSSSGHLSVLLNLIGVEYIHEDHLFFDAFLHLGALAAIFLVYRKELVQLFSETVAFLTGRENMEYADDGRFTPSVRNVFMLLFATMPLILVLPFYARIETLFYKTWFIGVIFLLSGCLAWITDKLSVGRKNEKTSTLQDALIIGLAQAISVIPGLSRTGTTLTVALARGYKKSYAMKFSLFLAIPAIVGAFFVGALDAIRGGIQWNLIPAYLIGLVFSALGSYVSLRLLKMLLDKVQFTKVAYYSWGAGVLTLILSLIF